jgi:hypothetical protein
MSAILNSYTLSKQWFDFAFENPDKINPNQGILYHWLIEVNNRNNWKEKFALNTEDAGIATGMKNRKTVWKTLNELISFGFVIVVFKSLHKHKATIISLPVLDSEAILHQSTKRTGKQITDPSKGQVNGLTDPNNGQVKEVYRSRTSPPNGSVNSFTDPVPVHQTDTLNKHTNITDIVLNNKTFKKEEEGKKMASPSSTLEIDFSVSKNEMVSESEFLEAAEIEAKILAELKPIPASQTKKIAQGGAVTQVLSDEEINDRITFDVNELKAKLKETTEEPEKKKLRQRIVALQGNYIVMMPFESDEFALAWEEWIDFKKKIRNNYQTVKGQQQALNDLAKDSKGSEEIAIKIINRSINNGWKGLFEIKENQNTTTKGNDFNDSLKTGIENSMQMGLESLERMQAAFESLNNE